MDSQLPIPRRRFLQAGLVCGTAFSVAGILPSKTAEITKPVRLGIVGIGGRGTSLLQTLLTLPGVEIAALCDILGPRVATAQGLVEKQTGKRPDPCVKGESGWQSLVERDDVDAVLIATPWECHAAMAVGAMKAGKAVGVEVPAAITLEECWELVRVSEQTGRSCMMLENVCYYQNVLTLLRMVREGCFGDLLHCEAGYQHDCRSLMFDSQGDLTWRGRHVADKNGNLYPTHPLGPVAQWLSINRGDRFTSLSSMSTPAKSLRQFVAARLGADHALARRHYAQGDVNTTLIQTANGLTVTLYFDILTHRPYDLILRLQGVKGIYSGSLNQVCLESPGSDGEKWEPFDPFLEKYAHPLWSGLAKAAAANGGHGGADYVMLYDFVRAIRQKAPTPQDVYDAATWSAVFPLSIRSVSNGGKPEPFPDFTRGKWKTNPPLPLAGV